MRPSIGWLVIGILAPLALGIMGLVATVSQIRDPCMEWGDQWGSYQSGGGTSQPAPGCPNGTSWTTQAPGHALLRGAVLPVGATMAGALGLVGILRHSGVAVGISAGILVALAGPLMLGMTAFLAWIPAFAVVLAARHERLTGRGGLRGFGILLAVLVAAMVLRTAWTALQGQVEIWMAFGLIVLVPFGLIAWMALSPPPAATQEPHA